MSFLNGFMVGSFLSQDSKDAKNNPWVWGGVAFVLTVLSVNVAFIVTAIKTNPGLVDENYYEKGRYHDANYQKKMETRNRLGWNISLQTAETITLNTPTNYSVSIVDRVGNPLKDAKVTLHAYRPSDASADFYAELSSIADGVFQNKLQLPLKGIWDINISVTQGDETLESTRRVTVVAN
ncbi:MAG: FixH family protein [Pseudomonadota bacterium]